MAARRLTIAALVGAGIVVASASAAKAHGVDPEGVAPMFDGPQFIGGATTFGLVLDDDGTFRWVPEEAIQQTTVHWQARLDDGRVLAGTFGGLMQTTDQGCSWSPVPGPLEGIEVTDFTVDPLEPSQLYVTTSSGGVDNGVFASSDAGETWAPLGELRPNSFYKRVIAAPGGASLWAAGLEAGTLAPFILHGDAQGSWQPVAAPLTGPGDVPLAELRLFRTGAEPDVFHVVARVDNQDRLLTSTDKFETLVERAAFAAEITAVGVLDDAVFVVLDRYQLWRARGDGAFEQVDDGPTRCLMPGPEPGELWGCGGLSDGAAFASTHDGETWTTALPYAEICPRACPEGTTGDTFGQLFWEPLQTNWGVGVDCAELAGDTDTDTDTGEPPSDEVGSTGGCACSLERARGSGRTGAAWMLALLVLVATRTRRNRVSPQNPATLSACSRSGSTRSPRSRP